MGTREIVHEEIMTTATKTLEAGTLAYDLAQHEPVVIIDPDVGTIAEQDDPMEELIRGSAGNQSCGFAPETQCVEVMFCNLDGVNSSTYTYPETRIGVPRMEVLEQKLTVREFVQYQTLKDLVSEAIRDGPETVNAVMDVWSASPLSEDVQLAVTTELSIDDFDAHTRE